MAYVIAIDIGGTFTDLVACDVETGAVAYTKSPTTYDRLGEAIFECIRKAAIDAREASFVKHGTTLVINALLQRVGAKTALLATKGFRDLLGDRPRQPHPAVRSAVSSRAAAHSARAALRRDRAGSRVRPGADAARHRRTQDAGRQDAGSGRGGARHQLPQLVPDAGPRAGRGGGNAPVVARMSSSPPAQNSRANGMSSSAPRRRRRTPMSGRRSASTSRNSIPSCGRAALPALCC